MLQSTLQCHQCVVQMFAVKGVTVIEGMGFFAGQTILTCCVCVCVFGNWIGLWESQWEACTVQESGCLEPFLPKTKGQVCVCQCVYTFLFTCISFFICMNVAA